MNYQEHHDKVISRAKGRILEGYTERHHIIPRCMGGGNDPENLVDLTPEEHYIVHQLLVKLYPENRRLVKAAMMMTVDHNGKRVNNKRYGWLRKKYAKVVSIEKTGQIPWNKGKKLPSLSNMHKTRIAASLKDKPKSLEHRQHISEATAGRTAWNKGKITGPYRKVVCPHCDKEGAGGIMNRWHFDNCKKAIA